MPPLAIAGAMAATSVAATGLSAFGQAQQGRDAYKAAHKQANRVIINSEFQVNDIERKRIRVASNQRAAFAASGVKLSGSPLEVLAETNQLAAQDKARVRYEARNNAQEIRDSGSAALSQSRYQAIGSILGGVGNAAQAGITGSNFAKAIG